MEIKYIYRPNEIFIIYFVFEDVPEWHIDFDIRGEDVEKFMNALRGEYQGTMQEMCEAAFTKHIERELFDEFCKKHGVKYDYFEGVIV